jgi:DNA-binding CsgD family transcriptional regulator
MLLDRLTERAALGQLLEAARAGRSGVLVVHGEAGVGKTALLEDAIAAAAGLRIARVAGIESEMELAYAALQQLCAPMLDGLDRLPDPQREALGVVFGLRTGEAPDRFLVGLAALSLLADAAGRQPLVCVIDDAQWLDRASAQALGFVARRLFAEQVAVVVATREPGGEFGGLPELAIGGLGDSAARELLASVIGRPLDERVQERFLAEAGGNPLALLELPRGLTPAELAGAFDVTAAPGLLRRLEDSFRQRLGGLPETTQRLLLVAAAEPTGDPVLVWRAAGLLGIGIEAAAPAEAEGLLTVGQRVTFRHPLVRSAAYRAASAEERRAAHRALADATDPQADPDRRAWHRAQAAAGPDEEVAAELERSAGRAQARGGIAAAAAFLDRATWLTPEPHRRARRALEAAQAEHLAGAHSAALALLAAAEAGPLDELQRARAGRLRAEIAYTRRNSDAPWLLLRAAERLEPLDLRLARETYLDALWAAHITGRLARHGVVREAAEAALRAPRPAPPPTVSDLLLDGLATGIVRGYPAGVPMLKQAVAEFRHPGASRAEELRWLWAASVVTRFVWDDESQDVLSARHVELGRQTGVLAGLPTALGARIVVHTIAGELTAADHVIEELLTLSDVMRIPMQLNGRLVVAAWRGRQEEASALIDAAVSELQPRGEGGALAVADYARAVLANGLGRYSEALTAAAATDAFDVDGFTIYAQGLSELIEAAARAGAAERAADALRRLAEMTQASGTDWGAGMRARAEALLSADDAAEALYREAIERLSRTRVRVELARAHLLYGEWLRRQNRRLDAREHLRTAHEMLSDMGVEAFAERARRELRATGAQALKRTAGTPDVLTAQEALIARLASQGASNPQIAAQLFISPATVAYHLGKVFAKLGISSRSQLARAFPNRPDAARTVISQG